MQAIKTYDLTEAQANAVIEKWERLNLQLRQIYMGYPTIQRRLRGREFYWRLDGVEATVRKLHSGQWVGLLFDIPTSEHTVPLPEGMDQCEFRQLTGTIA